MTVASPATFVLTDREAATVQSASVARQASVALIAASIAVPLLLLAAVFVVDFVWYGGAMPASLFVALLAMFVAGMFTQTLACKFTLEASKRRLRSQTRQVFAPRSVRLTDEGIEQDTPEQRALSRWSGIDRVEHAGGLIPAWAGNLLAAAVPERAFASAPDAQAFLGTCRQRAVAPQAGRD
jgi:hypothetical protein